MISLFIVVLLTSRQSSKRHSGTLLNGKFILTYTVVIGEYTLLCNWWGDKEAEGEREKPVVSAAILEKFAVEW